MMQILVRNSDGLVVGIGSLLTGDNQNTVYDLPDSAISTYQQLPRPNGGITFVNGVFATLPFTPDPPPPPQPNVKHALQALATSNLDAATKQQIGDALKGL